MGILQTHHPATCTTHAPLYEKRKGGEKENERGKREVKERKTQHINFLILNYVLSDFFGGGQKFHHLETIGSQKPLTD